MAGTGSDLSVRASGAAVTASSRPTGVQAAAAVPATRPTAASSSAAATATSDRVSVPVRADAYVVRSQPSRNFGQRRSLYATSGENRTFLSFDTDAAVPAGKKVAAASLRVYVLDRAVSTAGFEVHPAAAGWTETGLTAANRPAHVGRAVSASTPVPAERAWLSVPLTDVSVVAAGGSTSFELLHTVANSRMAIASRESGKAPTLELTLTDAASAKPSPTSTTQPATPTPTPTSSTTQPQSPGVLPFDMPSTSTLQSSKRLAFAHYFTPFPVSLDNKPTATDYYTRNFLAPEGERGKHKAYGGLIRDRPLGRAPLTGDYAAKDYETEVRQARAAGLDGFTVDILSLTSFHWDRAVALMEAARRVDPNFKIMLMPDMTTLDAQSSSALAAGIAKLSRYPAAFRLGDGRLVVSPFKAEAKSASWWKAWIATMKSTYGITVAFVPTILDWQQYIDDFGPISYGFSHWGLRNPDSNVNSAKHAIKAHGLGKVWMGPAHVQDARPSQGLFEEAGNTETLRYSWQGIIDGGADWVNMPTWNDYTEGTGVAPSQNHGWSYLDISSYYLTQWKTGRAPTIKRDALYLTHRNQPYAAKPSFQQTKLMKLRSGTTSARDTVEALVFLTAPARVTVKVGPRTYTWDAPAGVNAKTFPLGTGIISGAVARGGVTTTDVTSPFAVTATPLVQDMQYYAVSSLR